MVEGLGIIDATLGASVGRTAAGVALLLSLGLALAIAWSVVQTTLRLARPPRRGYAWAVARGVPGDPAEIVPVPPVGDAPADEATAGLSFESWTFRSRGLDLPVWDVRGLCADGPVVVFSHGWGESRVAALPRIAALAQGVSRFVAWDLPGHGEAPGTSRLGGREPDDLLALLDTLAGRNSDRGEQFPPIVLHGFSLGAGVSIEAAARDAPGRIAAVVAEAPYRVPMTPARNVLRAAAMPWRGNLHAAMVLLGLREGHGAQWASAHAPKFDRTAHAARLSAPLLVVHGTSDMVSPSEDGRAIANAAPRGEYAPIAGAGHLDLWTNPVCAPESRKAVLEFYGRMKNAAGNAPPR